MPRTFEGLLNPRSVAIVGASGRPGTTGYKPLIYLRRYGFEGSIYPVNPNYDEIEGIKCYPDIASIGAELDLVLSIVGASDTEAVIRDAGKAGARSVVVFSSGFADGDVNGQLLQDQIVAAADEFDLRLIGPNCMGVVYVPSKLAATFTSGVERGFPADDGIAYLGQSGAVGGAVLDLARQTGAGLTAWVSTGNQAQTDLVELARHFIEDEAIRVVTLYMESMNDGPSYVELTRRARELGKYLIILRTGRSNAGKRAVASHTGALLGPDAAFDLVSKTNGVVVVDEVGELLRAAFALRWLPPARGRNVAIVSSSGGAGSLAADQLEKRNLQVKELSADAQGALRPLVPAFAAVSNPIDVTAALFSQPEGAFRAVLEAAGHLEEVDVLVVIVTNFTGEGGVQLANGLVGLQASIGKPVFVVWMAIEHDSAEGRRVLRNDHIAVFDSASEAAQCCELFVGRTAEADRQSAHFESPRDRISASEVAALRTLIRSGLVLEAEGIAVLDTLCIPRPAAALVTSEDEAELAAEPLGEAVVMKLQAPDLIHKSEYGAVRVGVPRSRVREVFRDLMNSHAERGGATPTGVLLQEQALPGLEMLVGVTKSSSNFPPCPHGGIWRDGR